MIVFIFTFFYFPFFFNSFLFSLLTSSTYNLYIYSFLLILTITDHLHNHFSLSFHFLTSPTKIITLISSSPPHHLTSLCSQFLISPSTYHSPFLSSPSLLTFLSTFFQFFSGFSRSATTCDGGDKAIDDNGDSWGNWSEFHAWHTLG